MALSPSCTPFSLAQSPFPFPQFLSPPYPAPCPSCPGAAAAAADTAPSLSPLILHAGRADVLPRVLKQRLWGAWGRRGVGRGHGNARDVAARGQAQGCGPSRVQAAECGVRHGSSPSSVGVGRGEPRAGRRGTFRVSPRLCWGGESFKKESSASWKLGSVSESSTCQERPRGHRDAAVTARLWDPWGNHLAPVVGSRWGSSQTGSKLRFTREYLCT